MFVWNEFFLYWIKIQLLETLSIKTDQKWQALSIIEDQNGCRFLDNKIIYILFIFLQVQINNSLDKIRESISNHKIDAITAFRTIYKAFESSTHSEGNLLLNLRLMKNLFAIALDENRKNCSKLVTIMTAVKALVTKLNERFRDCGVEVCDGKTTQEVFLIRIYLNMTSKAINSQLQLTGAGIDIFESTEKSISDNLNLFSYIDSDNMNTICTEDFSTFLSENFTKNHELWKIYEVLLSMSSLLPRRTECINSVNDLPIPLQINLVSLRSPEEILSNTDNESCSICYENFGNDENVVITDSCKHIFCIRCTENWFKDR